MAITFTQAQVDAAVVYLMTGGPNGGELTDQAYHDMAFVYSPLGILSAFALQLQLAIEQHHSGISLSHNLARNKFGDVTDSFQTNPEVGTPWPNGIGHNMVVRNGASILG